jgi:hypothetical protein
MSGTPNEPVTPSPDDRNLFKNVIVREGGKVTIDFDRLGEDADQAVDVAGVLASRVAAGLGEQAKGLWAALSSHIKDAHAEVKAKRAAAAKAPEPPADQAPPA